MRRNYLWKILLTICLSCLVSSCIFVAGAAAGAAGIAVVYDHRTLESRWQDTRISNEIIDDIRRVAGLRLESHIEVTVFNRIVLLTGETPNAAWKNQAAEIARNVEGVVRVYNQIRMQGPTSGLTRTSDTWITTKIKSEMLATENLKSGSIKVVTENGVVYLMGKVNHEQADIATDISRQVSGVQRVVKIFQYKSK